MKGERVIAGTDTGRLLVFESGDLRREISTASKAVQEQSDRSEGGPHEYCDNIIYSQTHRSHTKTYEKLALCLNLLKRFVWRIEK